MKLSGDKWSAIRRELLQIEPGGNNSPWKKQLSLMLLKIINEQKITKDAITSVSGGSVIVRYVKFENLHKSNYQKPSVWSGTVYSFSDTGCKYKFSDFRRYHGRRLQKMETILVMQKEIIQNKIDILTEVGLRPVVVDVDSFALENSISVNAEEEIKMFIWW